MTGEQTLDDALRQVEENADEDWRAAAYRIVNELVAAGNPFTADDVWDRLDRLDVDTHERRALGAYFARLSRTGAVRRIGAAKSRRRRSTNSVWLSTEDPRHVVRPEDEDDLIVLRVGDLRRLFDETDPTGSLLAAVRDLAGPDLVDAIRSASVARQSIGTFTFRDDGTLGTDVSDGLALTWKDREAIEVVEQFLVDADLGGR